MTLGMDNERVHRLIHTERAMRNPNDDDDRPDWEKAIRPRFTALDDKDGEGARPSSLIKVNRPAVIDPLHELNLLRMMQLANERTLRELGPLPPGRVPVVSKCKPKSWRAEAAAIMKDNEEDETMRLTHAVTMATMAVGTLVTCGANGGSSQGRAADRAVTPVHQEVKYAGGTTRVVLSRQCGDLEVRLSCPVQSGTANCMRTALSLRRDGTLTEIDKPQEMENYTAVGMGCVSSAKNGKPYFVVQYGELPEGCVYCEWFYLYDGNGRQLTKSDPPLLFDENLPGNDKHFPNNREFEQLSKDLQLSRLKFEFVDCNANIDDQGNATCLKEAGRARE